MKINIIRSSRRTICVEIRSGELTVRAPRTASDADIESFLAKNRQKIEKHITKVTEAEKKLADVPVLTEDELDALTAEAKKTIPPRVRYYAALIGVEYGRITVRRQKTRWGSCSAKGDLSFNCLLMLAPSEALDSVIVHELCHRKEMNHSKRFYAQIARVFPDYAKWRRWLKDNGPALIKRLPE